MALTIKPLHQDNIVFIVSIIYTSPLDVIDKFVDEHILFLDTQYQLGHFQLSGRKNPRTGGVILTSVSNRAQLDLILSMDPFKREGLAHYEIIEFTPTKSSHELEFLIKQSPAPN